jgi:hypothetical protein
MAHFTAKAQLQESTFRAPSEEILQRLDRIEAALVSLVEQRREREKEYYSTAEGAKILNRAEFTVREWCRQGRIHAEKQLAGRGRAKEWMISREEIERIQNEGLLPL